MTLDLRPLPCVGWGCRTNDAFAFRFEAPPIVFRVGVPNTAHVIIRMPLPHMWSVVPDLDMPTLCPGGLWGSFDPSKVGLWEGKRAVLAGAFFCPTHRLRCPSHNISYSEVTGLLLEL